MEEKKKGEKIPTTGGPVSKEEIPGMAFEGHLPIGSKKEEELLKAREVIDQELLKIRDARGKAEFEKTPEGKKWQKQWEDHQELIRRQEEEAKRVYEEILIAAKRLFVLNHFADELLAKGKVNQEHPEFEKVLKHVRDIYNLVQGHYYEK